MIPVRLENLQQNSLWFPHFFAVFEDIDKARSLNAGFIYMYR